MTATLTGIRPSLWARCLTAAVFQGRGEEEAEHAPEMEEYWFRGNVFEEIVARQAEAKHGKANVERQVIIPIPGIGQGHADFYLRHTKTLCEVKSTTSPYPNSDTFSFGVKQLQIYLAYHPEAAQGALYMLDPNRMRAADIYEVRLTDEDREQIEWQRAQIVLATSHLATDNPDDLWKHGHEHRPCTKPSQARGRMCPFATQCFHDWEPPDPNPVTDPSAVDAAARLYTVKQEIRIHEQAVKDLDEEKKAAEADLADVTVAGDNTIGPFTVKRTDVKRSPTFSAKAAAAAGFPVHTLDEWMRPGAEYSTFRVERAEAAGEVDYGDVPWDEGARP